MIRKTLLLSIVIYIAAVTASAFGAGITLNVESISGSPGPLVPVPIYINGLTTEVLYGIDLWVTYDSNCIEAVDVLKGDLVQTWNIVSNTSIPGVVKIALYSTSPLAIEEGSLAIIQFNVKANAMQGDTTISLTRGNLNETPADTIQDGTFSVLGSAPQYALNIVAVNGLVSKNPDKIGYNSGESVILTAVPYTDYHFTGWSGGLSGTTNPATIIMDGNKTVTANFAINTYTITASAGTGGTITPSGSVAVNHGANQTFSISANAAYSISDVLVDTVSVGPVNSYTFTSVVSPHTIETRFALTTFIAYNDFSDNSSLGGSGGSTGNVTNINPDNDPGNLIAYADGQNTGVTLTISSWVLEGTGAEESHGPLPVYPLTGTDAYAEFGTAVNLAGIDYYNTGASYSIELSGVSNEATYTLVILGMRGNPNYAGVRYTSYTISSVASFVNQSSMGASISTKTITSDTTTYCTGDNWNAGYVAKWIHIKPVNSKIIVTVTGIDTASRPYLSALKLAPEGALPPTYTITATAGANGSITPSGNVVVNHGTDKTFNIGANTGYQILDVLVDGTSVGAVATYTFTNVTAIHTIIAHFAVESVPPVISTTFPTPEYITTNGLVPFKAAIQDNVGLKSFRMICVDHPSDAITGDIYINGIDSGMDYTLNMNPNVNNGYINFPTQGLTNVQFEFRPKTAFYNNPAYGSYTLHTYWIGVYDMSGNWTSKTARFNIYQNGGSGGDPGGSGCFLAGTPILMADIKGTDPKIESAPLTKPIEEIKVGDTILAYDEATGTFKPDKVKRVFVFPEEPGYLVINGHIKVTPKHRFLIKDKWVEAGSLKAGDRMLTSKDKPEPITSIERMEAKVTVYNLEVNPYHTFIADGIVVHNIAYKSGVIDKSN